VGLLIPPVAISLAYVTPTGNGKLIRNIPFLKIFLIALTWTWVSILLPHALSNQFELFSVSFILIMAERFLFIFAITIPFDIRDVEQDQRESLDTIVKVVGPSKAKYLSIGILTAATLIGYILYVDGTWQLNYWLLHILIIVYAGLLVYRVHSDRRDAYYSWGLDGSMLLLGMIEGLYFIL
jgi:4-hydroxybenzoate polyprenyltransferase